MASGPLTREWDPPGPLPPPRPPSPASDADCVRGATRPCSLRPGPSAPSGGTQGFRLSSNKRPWLQNARIFGALSPGRGPTCTSATSRGERSDKHAREPCRAAPRSAAHKPGWVPSRSNRQLPQPISFRPCPKAPPT